jgi:hypothetical protein
LRPLIDKDLGAHRLARLDLPRCRLSEFTTEHRIALLRRLPALCHLDPGAQKYGEPWLRNHDSDGSHDFDRVLEEMAAQRRRVAFPAEFDYGSDAEDEEDDDEEDQDAEHGAATAAGVD